jgi:hypothetical protein
MHKNALKCNKTQSKWCINKHGASKIIDTFEMYHSLVGMLFLNQLTYIVFFILLAQTRRCNYKIPFHWNIFTSWVPHNSSLGFKDFFHLVCRSICLGTSKTISCSRSYLVITTPWHPLSCSVSSYSFLHVLSMDLNRRSQIVLDTSTWSWPLTQDPFHWTLVLMV